MGSTTHPRSSLMPTTASRTNSGTTLTPGSGSPRSTNGPRRTTTIPTDTAQAKKDTGATTAPAQLNSSVGCPARQVRKPTRAAGETHLRTIQSVPTPIRRARGGCWPLRAERRSGRNWSPKHPRVQSTELCMVRGDGHRSRGIGSTFSGLVARRASLLRDYEFHRSFRVRHRLSCLVRRHCFSFQEGDER